ncbi:DUF6336 family protein [Streptomyces sp. NPDC057806]|uniref:DUF6336 family protein n=1 Tax=Streptomyces sp. NPDC057806 TaxID=3346255 RepID=UPI003674613E
MALDRDGVMLPRLRLADVARRGMTFGLLGVVPLTVATFSISDHTDREEFLAVVGALACLFGLGLVAVGAGFWWASAEDIRRLRDWRTLTTQAASVTIIGPSFLRSGLFLSVLGAAAIGLYPLVSWLHG